MPIVFGDQIRFKVFQEMQGQQILNTMHYDVEGGDLPVTDAQMIDLCRGFGQEWHSRLQARQTTALAYLSVQVEVLNTPWFGTYTFPPATTGASAGDPMPIFTASAVQHVRSNKITRHGWTRLSGLTEVDNQAGNISADWRNLVLQWADFFIRPQFGAAVLNLPLLDEDNNSYGSVACRNIIWGGNSAGFPLGRWQYVSSHAIKTRLTTQNTRKIGSGA